MKVDFGGNAHAAAVRRMEQFRLRQCVNRRNEEFVEALRREGKTKRQLMQERLEQLEKEMEASYLPDDPPVCEVYNLIEAVEEFLESDE